MQKLHRPILSLFPERLDISSAWVGHIPFAYWVIDAVKPTRLVELGTHGGVSYCAFCQAIEHLELPTTAHAIDTWEGDSHTGDYPSDTYFELKAYHDERYSGFSDLVRTTFDNAAQKFADNSIDLLHIDGLHTLDAVKHDFETWLPKLNENAVVLFHDINVYERDFGVQEFWRDVSQRYPSFAFEHGHGLGVLAVGNNQSKAIEWLTTLSPDQTRTVRDSFSRWARPLHTQASQTAEIEGLRSELARIDALRHEAVEQSNALAEQANRLNELRIELERDVLSLGEISAQREDELANRDAQLVEQQRDYAQIRTTMTADLARSEELAHKLTSDLSQMKSSTSWRLTAPLRYFREVGNRTVGGDSRAHNAGSAGSAIYRSLRAPGGIARAVSGLRKRGLRGSVSRLRQQVAAAKSLHHQLAGGDSYADWVLKYDTLSAQDLESIAQDIETLEYQPLISIVLPVYNTAPQYLQACLDSVLDQTYHNWQLCIADDSSPDAAPRRVIERYAALDSRITYVFRASQGGIASCTNSALELSTGEFVALLDHDDLLPAHALYMVVSCLNENTELDLIYSDEDKIDEQGVRFDPHFKSDFNHELLLGQNCISHLGVYRTSLVQSLGGIREGFDGSQDHDLALRVVKQSQPKRIAHIPHILYHWRVFGESGSFSTTHLDRAVDAGVRAVRDHLGEETGVEVEPAAVGGYLRVRWPLPDTAPSVTAIVPTRDNADLLGACIEGLLKRTDYPGLQVLIIDNGSEEARTLELLSELGREQNIRVVRYDQPFNYSAINNFAVEHVDTEFLCLLNDDIQMIGENWLSEMMALAVRDNVGAVGARLLYADDTVQHAGVVLGVMGVANHLHKHLHVDDPGYFGRLQLCQQTSGSTAACLVVKRSVYTSIGGLNEKELSVAFNDVDFCLRLMDAGYRNLWTPEATLYHMESASRGSDMDRDKFKRFEAEVNYMQERWGESLRNDPFYNLNLSLEGIDMALAEPPRALKPWRQDG